MLSILIPVYNFDVHPLVQHLQQQALNLAASVEIICLDDASEPAFQEKNASLANLEGVIYHVLPQNVGRAAIRNLLAEQAQYPYLLFMDSDSMPPDTAFIQRYLTALQPDRLLYGGRSYQATAPKEVATYFHWYYGSQREVRAVQVRQAAPYQAFMTNNFVIPKAIFEAIKFNETLKQYGHEDTLFGYELRRRNIPIEHLDNPLLHIGLESFEHFLNKSKQAIENLYYLQQQYDLAPEIRLLRFFKQTNRWKLHSLLYWGYQLSFKFFLRRLQQKKPNLYWFDCYKLGYLIALSRNTQNTSLKDPN